MNTLTLNLLPQGLPVPPLYFHTASSRFPQPTMRYGPGEQGFHQILLVVSGTGLLRCGGNTYPLERGCAFFTAQGYPSEYENTGGLITAFLTVRGEAMDSLLRYYGCGAFLFTRYASVEEMTARIQQIAREYYDHKCEGRLSAYAYSFCVDFFEQQKEARLTCAEQVGLYLERNFSQKITLDSLAKMNSISVSKLCHDFKSHYGCTIFAYLLHLRLTYARSLLRTSSETRTKDAAHACGFEDISYFCKAYKKKFGKSPAQDSKD